MNNDSAGKTDESEDTDAGVPIAGLAQFEHSTSAGFLARFRRAVERRTTVAQLTNFSAIMPLAVLMEFWLMMVHQLSQKSTRKDTKHE